MILADVDLVDGDGDGDNTMTVTSREQLAELLVALKKRSGHSYDALARRSHLSRSALHRVCTGRSLPAEFATIERIARSCGARQSEVMDLHRYWLRVLTADEAVPSDHSTVAEDATESSSVPPSKARVNNEAARGPGWRYAVAGVAAITLVVVTALWFRTGESDPTTVQMLPGPAWTTTPTPIGPEFFAVTAATTTGNMPSSGIGAVRLWDSRTRWSNLEPQDGKFEWLLLDRLVAGAKRRNLPILLTFGGTPGWAAPGGTRTAYDDDSRTAPPDDLAKWDRFVHQVVARYGGLIAAYELWAMAPSEHFYTGDPHTLAEMTRRASAIIGEVDPDATIVCPSMGDLWDEASQKFLARFAAAGGYDVCDKAGMNLHPQDLAKDPPEATAALGTVLDRIFHEAGRGLKWWNVGSAYEITSVGRLDQHRQAEYAVRYYMTAIYMRIQRAYFYSWGSGNLPVVLQKDGGEPTRAAQMVQALAGWLVGAQVTGCGQGRESGLPDNVWQCSFICPDGSPGGKRVAVVRWSSVGAATTNADPAFTRVHHLDGHGDVIGNDGRVDVGTMPVMLD